MDGSWSRAWGGLLLHDGKQALTAVEAARQARQILIDGVPEVSKLYLEAARIAAAKGDHRPALDLLNQFPIEDADGKKTRILEPATRRQAEMPFVPQVVIGFTLPTPPSPLPAVQVIHPAPNELAVDDDVQEVSDDELLGPETLLPVTSVSERVSRHR